ncbi:MAG: SEC-C domain-containing protein, partial [Gemmatimonadota bacterium]|nr:SEC-C domain-containing protein [Gemmatimonadota bacterium]
EVLNAKYHQREAEIVAQAGRVGAVTIATNMAGRGTDIKLDPALDLTQPEAGLQIIGTERHESRRIDRQLRGRSGRQGDPGSSQFFLSLEDDLMRLFGSDRIAKLMDRLGAQEGEVLTHPLITRSIEQAQKRVELQHFQARKRLLEYDDVMNQQREVIYSLRTFALEGGEELKGEALRMVERAIAQRVESELAEYERAEDWDIPLLQQDLLMHYLLSVPELDTPDLRPTTLPDAVDLAVNAGRAAFAAKITNLNQYKDEQGGFADRLLALVMLNVLDEKWKDHLYDLDQLRNSIQYRSWGQKDPLVEYKGEAYAMFVDLMSDIYTTFAERFLRAQLQFTQPAPAPVPAQRQAPAPPKKRYNALGVLEEVPAESPDGAEAGAGQTLDVGPAEPPAPAAAVRRDPIIVGAGRPRTFHEAAAPAAADWSSVGRNDPCPCGSGKKFKKCHGAGA